MDPDDPALVGVITTVHTYGDNLAKVGAILAMCSVDDDSWKLRVPLTVGLLIEISLKRASGSLWVDSKLDALRLTIYINYNIDLKESQQNKSSLYDTLRYSYGGEVLSRNF